MPIALSLVMVESCVHVLPPDAVLRDTCIRGKYLVLDEMMPASVDLVHALLPATARSNTVLVVAKVGS